MTPDEFYDRCERLLADQCSVTDDLAPGCWWALWKLGRAIDRARPGVADRMAGLLLEDDRG